MIGSAFDRNAAPGRRLTLPVDRREIFPNRWGLFPDPRRWPPASGAISAVSAVGTSPASGLRMSNMRASSLLLTASLIAGAGACVPMSPPSKTAASSSSYEGIQVAVLGQSCAQSQEPDQYGWDLIEEDVEIEVRNAALVPVTVHPDQFRLVAPDGSAPTTVTWGAADPLTLAGGASRTLELRFLTRGGLECAKQVRLDPTSRQAS
jgi:hypothetical protein